MRKFRFAFSAFCLSLLLVACASGKMPRTRDDRLTVREEGGQPGQIAFTIRDGSAVLTQYRLTHTKEMHLIALRDDLEGFQHLHPERDAEGVWRTAFTPIVPGHYWFFADFMDGAAVQHVLPFTRQMGEGGGAVQESEAEMVKDPDGYDAAQKIVDGYRIQVSTLQTATDDIEFHYTVLDPQGRDAALEDYLGAKGHSVLISPEGDYLHTHPFTEYVGYKPTDRPIFIVHKPRDPMYRVFTQFQVRGKVLTVFFDMQTPPSVSGDAETGEEDEQGGESDGHGNGGHGGEPVAAPGIEALQEE